MAPGAEHALAGSFEKAKTLIERHPQIPYAFMFGSALRQLLPDSDIDILVGGELSFSERTDLSLGLEQLFHRPVDVVLSRHAPAELVLRALARGQVLLMRDPESLKRDYYEKYQACEDALGLWKVRQERLYRRFSYGR